MSKKKSKTTCTADEDSLKVNGGTLYGSTWSNNQVPASVNQSTTMQQVDIKPSRQRVWTVLLSTVVACLPGLLGGCALAFPSGALLDLTDLEPRPDYKFDTTLSDVFGALAPIGALLGGPIAGWIADHAGRKAALMLVGIPYLVGYLMMVYAHFINQALVFKVVLLVGRFFTGLGLGWSCLATPVYLAEISSNKLRGVFTAFTEIFMAVGVLLIYLLASFEKIFPYYNSSLALSGIVAVFELSMVFLYETPRWLLAHKRKEEAIKALKFFRGAKYDFTMELTVIENDIVRYPKLKILQTFFELGKRQVLLPLLIICAIMFLQQISGIEAMDAYSTLIFKEAGVEDYRLTSAYAVGGLGVVFTVLGAFIVDYIGRKILLIVSGIGMLVGTASLGTFFYFTRPELCANATLNTLTDASDDFCNAYLSPVAIASLILLNIAFSIGWGPVPWVLLGELIPLRVRGVGSGIAIFVNWGAAAIVTGFYLDYAEAVKTWFAWWSFSIVNAVAVLFVVLFVFETKGKNLEDIQHKFDRKH